MVSSRYPSTMSVVTGVECLLASDRLHGCRVGLLANPASVDSQLVHVADRFRRATDFRLVALFGPQHGFHADMQDNMIESPHARRSRAAACRSIRSTARRASPRAEMLDGLDVLVIDLQDVGTRVYTFVYTMANCLRAAARARRARHRVRSAEPDRRRRGPGPDARARLRVVRRAVSNAAAARHDDRASSRVCSTSGSDWARRSKWCPWKAGRARCTSTTRGFHG